MIDSKEVTFVMQGIVDRELTSEALESIRKYFPQSHVILSTWEGSDVKGLDVDQLILSSDPGGFKKGEVRDKSENVNRLITSAFNGLREVKTDYAVKTRTDIVMQNNNLLQYLSEFCLDSDRIVQSNLVIGNPFSELFHPSDTFLAGKASVIKRFFDVSLAPKSLMKNLAPEQYLGILNQNFCDKKLLESYLTSLRYGVDLNLDQSEFDNELILNSSLNYLSENFVTLLDSELGTRYPDRIVADSNIISYMELLLRVKESEPEKIKEYVRLYLEWRVIEAKLRSYKGLKKKLLKIKRSIFKRKYMKNNQITLN